MSQYNIDFLLHTKKYLNILVVLWFMEANLAQSGFIDIFINFSQPSESKCKAESKYKGDG